jgi:hypothetical protein
MDINKLRTMSQTLFKRVPSEMESQHVPVLIPLPTVQAIQVEGIHEQKKNEAIKKAEDRQTVNDLIKKSNRCIYRMSSVFPWDLFPNVVEVEESRVTCIFHQFLSSQSYSVDIKDISNVFIQSSLFFATLQIVSRTFTQNNITMGHLNVHKARRAQMIIEGLRTLVEHDIDTSNYEISELVSKIEEFHTNETV